MSKRCEASAARSPARPDLEIIHDPGHPVDLLREGGRS
jgi:hypothetical protein